jgi:hypothetical protein
MRYIFDMVNDDGSLAAVLGQLAMAGLQVRVLNMEGPGGGHPEVEITGDPLHVQALMIPLGWDDTDLSIFEAEDSVS